MSRLDGIRNAIKRVTGSRILPADTARAYDIPVPVSLGMGARYDVGNIGTPSPTGIPPGSGLAYVFSPYQQFYTKLYGVIPIADLTKYRQIYRTQPDVMGRINKRVTLSTGKGFSIQCDDPEGAEAAQWLEKWAEDVKLDECLRVIGTDMLVYGTGYLELVWDQGDPLSDINPDDEPEAAHLLQPPDSKTASPQPGRQPLRAWVEETTLCDKCFQHTLYGIRYIDDYTFYGDKNSMVAWTCQNPECNDKNPEHGFKLGFTNLQQVFDCRFDGQDKPPEARPVTPFGQPMQQTQPGYHPPAPGTPMRQVKKPKGAKTIVNMKYLDPLYMRVRSDAYGNVFGWYQWLAWPPVFMTGDVVLQFKFNPQSWGYETMYGTSLLMPLIKNNDLLAQFENDMSVWIHTYGKPMLHVMGGTPEQPYTDPQMKALAGAFKARKPGSDVLTKSNVTITPIQATMRTSGQAITEWQQYLLSRRKEILGVPDALMGQSGTGAGSGGSNRSTATVALEDFITDAEMFQNQLSHPFESRVFPALLRENGFKAEADEFTFRMVWKPIFEEDPNTRSQRLIDKRKNGIMSVNEVRAQDPELGIIPEDDPRYTPALDDPMAPIPSPGTLRAEGDPGAMVQQALNDGSMPPSTPGAAPAGTLGPTSATTPQGMDPKALQAERSKDIQTLKGKKKKKDTIFQAGNMQRAVSIENGTSKKLKKLLDDYVNMRITKPEAVGMAQEIIAENAMKTKQLALSRLSKKAGVKLATLPTEIETQHFNRSQARLSEFRRILDDVGVQAE